MQHHFVRHVTQIPITEADASLHFNSTRTMQVFNFLAASREPAGAAPKEAFLEERGAALVEGNLLNTKGKPSCRRAVRLGAITGS